jgi:hypothetical protein
MSQPQAPYQVHALPNAGISKEAIRLCRFIDRLPKEGKFIITLEKVDNEWRVTITEVKVEKILEAAALV